MNINDIISLCNAGFSRTEIAKMAAQEVQNANPAPAPAPAPTPAPAPNPAMDTVLQEIQKLNSQIQGGMIINSNQPALENVDDILANIINPPTIKKE